MWMDSFQLRILQFSADSPHHGEDKVQSTACSKYSVLTKFLPLSCVLDLTEASGCHSLFHVTVAKGLSHTHIGILYLAHRCFSGNSPVPISCYNENWWSYQKLAIGSSRAKIYENQPLWSILVSLSQKQRLFEIREVMGQTECTEKIINTSISICYVSFWQMGLTHTKHPAQDLTHRK